jgi:hypothetical protein
MRFERLLVLCTLTTFVLILMGSPSWGIAFKVVKAGAVLLSTVVFMVWAARTYSSLVSAPEREARRIQRQNQAALEQELADREEERRLRRNARQRERRAERRAQAALDEAEAVQQALRRVRSQSVAKSAPEKKAEPSVSKVEPKSRWDRLLEDDES